jgi:non-specific serine/threonine protein kinase
MNAQSPGQPLLWRFGNVVFDEQALTLTVAGTEVELERRPLELLSLLLVHAGEVVTKDEILDALWPDREVSEASLTKCMARLRSAIGDEDHEIIKTAHGHGYRFAAPVTAQETSRKIEIQPAIFVLKEGDPVPHRPGWTLVRRLGVGGFGDAWLGKLGADGEQRVFKFALKDSRLSALRREVALGRLLREGLGPREDINRILDWNFAEQPYFIETPFWFEGNLAEWCEKQGGIRSVSLDMRIALVAKIADALSAAHSMGVLHKDLKPANVLIRDGEDGPSIVLSDFGSGRALDPSRLAAFGITGLDGGPTEPEATSGTALYRAPELLAGGAPTVQADLYALGVLLFQLVTGDFRRPLAPGWEHLVDDPLVRADIADAAAGDPARRLGDAAELARRLRSLEQRRTEALRNANAEAELAKARSALERSRARRIPLIALLVVLAAGLAMSTWLYLRAERAQKLAEATASRERAVTHFLTDDLLSSANPLLAGNPDIKVKDVLGTATGKLDKNFPSGGLDRAAIEAALGQVYAGLADPKHAEALLNASLARRKAALGDAAPETQAVRIALGDLYEREVDNAGLARIGREVLASNPVDAATQLHGRYYTVLGGCANGDTGLVCINELRKLLGDARAALGVNDPLTLRIQIALAFHLAYNEKAAEGVPLARQAIARFAQIYGPDHPLVQEQRYQLAQTLIQAGSIPEAIAILEDVHAKLFKIAGHETELTARANNQIGYAYTVAKRYDDALRYVRLALDYNVATRGETFELSREGYNNIANLQSFSGHYHDAVVAGEKALRLETQVKGSDDPDTLWFANNLGTYYEKDGNLAEAERVFADLIARGRKRFTHGEWDLGHFLFHLGEIQAERHETAAARATLTESVRILTKALGPQNKRTAAAKAALDKL